MEFYYIYIQKEIFFSHVFSSHFSVILFFGEKKRLTYQGGFQKCFIRFYEISKRTAIATPRKNGKIISSKSKRKPKEKLTKTIVNGKLLIQTKKENQELLIKTQEKSEEKQQEYQQNQLDYPQKELEYQKEMEEKQLKYEKNGRKTAQILKTSFRTDKS